MMAVFVILLIFVIIAAAWYASLPPMPEQTVSVCVNEEIHDIKNHENCERPLEGFFTGDSNGL